MTDLSKVSDFFKKKGVVPSFKAYFVDAMGAMALGLFASLLVGTILGTVAKYTNFTMLADIAKFAQQASGAVIAIAIANSLKAPPLVMYSAGAVGVVSYTIGATFTVDGIEKTIGAGPAGVFFAAIVAVEFGKIVSKETKVDILVTPLVTILTGSFFAYLICPAVAWLMYQLGAFINTATEMQPLLMGIIISSVVGVILTLPISSAAICAMIGISGIAGGAATAGCCAQMIGFAVISFRENGCSGLLAQGLGTSMLQMGNLTKKPVLWIAPTLASAFCGPVSTCLFGLENTGVSAGMGTCGMVGPIGIISTMGGGAKMWIGILLVCIVLPAVLSLLFDFIMRKLNWRVDGDLKLEL